MTFADRKTIRIAVPWIQEAFIQQRRWNGYDVQYEIGKIGDPHYSARQPTARGRFHFPLNLSGARKLIACGRFILRICSIGEPASFKSLHAASVLPRRTLSF